MEAGNGGSLTTRWNPVDKTIGTIVSVFELLLFIALLIAVYMLVFWMVSLPLQNASIIDIGWGLGFVMIAWATCLLANTDGPRAWLLVALPTAWGLRLSGYLFWRNHGQGEDRRYVAMREKHGKQFWWVSLFTVFGLQGVVMWIVALPLAVGIAGANEAPAIGLLHVFGAVVWLVGMLFETGGDWQLANFKANPENEGQVMDRGFWRYTRHPNYFGDFLVWWGHWLVSLAAVSQIWTIVSPVVMSALLMQFSGVGLLEHDIADRRPNYAEYKRRTQTFFPWWPKQS